MLDLAVDLPADFLAAVLGDFFFTDFLDATDDLARGDFLDDFLRDLLDAADDLERGDFLAMNEFK